MRPKKIVLPVAGLGKRLRPLTLTTPKNLVLLNGRPILEYTLEEARRAGLTEVILVVSPNHREAYEDYLSQARSRFPEMNFQVREQANPWGDGHAILQAADLIGEDPFVVRFCDDIIWHDQPSLAPLVDLFEERKAPVIFSKRVPQEEVSRWGVLAAEPSDQPGLYRIFDLVEKPKAEEAPSNLIVIGGYVLPNRILERLRKMSANMDQANDALRLAYALAAELRDGQEVYAWEFPGTHLDCGTLDGLKNAEKHIQESSSKFFAFSN